MERISTADGPRLLDQVREVIRIRHYSIRTEQAYVQWIRRFILFHGKRHLRDMDGEELTAFLSHLASQFGYARCTSRTCAMVSDVSTCLSRSRPSTRTPIAIGMAVRLSVEQTLDGSEVGCREGPITRRRRAAEGIQARSPECRSS
jgi:hypothetical protein